MVVNMVLNFNFNLDYPLYYSFVAILVISLNVKNNPSIKKLFNLQTYYQLIKDQLINY